MTPPWQIMPSPRTSAKKVSTVVAEPEEHKHEWQDGAVTEKDEVSYSPCSTADDHLWTWIIQHQSCACGARRQLALGYKNRRRRGDDARIANGLRPLGTPLQRNETFNPPKRFR